MHSDAATQAVGQSLENKRAELALRQCSARNYAGKKDLPLWWLVFVLVLLLRLLLLSRPFLLLARWGLLPLRLRWLLLLRPLLGLLTWRRCGPLLFLLACIGRRRPGGRWSVIALICRTFVVRRPIRLSIGGRCIGAIIYGRSIGLRVGRRRV